MRQMRQLVKVETGVKSNNTDAGIDARLQGISFFGTPEQFFVHAQAYAATGKWRIIRRAKGIEFIRRPLVSTITAQQFVFKVNGYFLNNSRAIFPGKGSKFKSAYNVF